MFASSKDTKANSIQDSVAHEAGHLIDDVKESVQHIKNDVHAATSRSDWEQVAYKTGHEARKLADTAGHNLVDAGQVLTYKIREKPVQWSLVALGLGLLIGKMFRR